MPPVRVTLPPLAAAVDTVAAAVAPVGAAAAADMIAVVVPSPESVVCVLLALDAVERFLFRSAVAAAATGLIASSDEPVWHSVNGIEVAIWTLQRERQREREKEK